MTRSTAARPPRVRALTVQGWFRVVFTVLAVLGAAAVLTVAGLLAAGRHASGDLENGILPAQAQAFRLQGALVDQETGVRGFGITGNRQFLQPYTAGLATETAAAARLRALTGGNRQLSADLAGLERAANAWRRTSAGPLIALRPAGRWRPAGRRARRTPPCWTRARIPSTTCGRCSARRTLTSPRRRRATGPA